MFNKFILEPWLWLNASWYIRCSFLPKQLLFLLCSIKTLENVSLPDISSTTAPTKSTAIIPAELQTHGACQGLKGPAHHVSQFHFYKATLSHIFIKKYSQSQRNIKAALSDFWTHLIECWRRTMCIMDFLMFSVQHALCFAFDKWGPNGF